jgi:hypothetical protein
MPLDCNFLWESFEISCHAVVFYANMPSVSKLSAVYLTTIFAKMHIKAGFVAFVLVALMQYKPYYIFHVSGAIIARN